MRVRNVFRLQQLSWSLRQCHSCPTATNPWVDGILRDNLGLRQAKTTHQIYFFNNCKTILRTVSTDGARETRRRAHSFLFPTSPDKTYCQLGRRSFWLLILCNRKTLSNRKKLLLADPAHVFLSKQVPSHIPEIKAYYRFPYIHWQNPTYLTIFFFTHKNKYRTKVILDWKSACNWKHGKQTENFYWNSISNCYYYRGSCYKLEGYCKQLLLTGWNEMFGDWENWKIIFYQVVNLKMKFPIILPLKPASKETPVY